jgi:hypothetical protein
MRSTISALVLLTTIVAGQEPTLILYSDDACATQITTYACYGYESCTAPVAGAGSYQITNSEDAACDQAQEYYDFAIFGDTGCSGTPLEGEGGCYSPCTSLSGSAFGGFQCEETMLDC